MQVHEILNEIYDPARHLKALVKEGKTNIEALRRMSEPFAGWISSWGFDELYSADEAMRKTHELVDDLVTFKPRERIISAVTPKFANTKLTPTSHDIVLVSYTFGIKEEHLMQAKALVERQKKLYDKAVELRNEIADSYDAYLSKGGIAKI